MTAARPPKLESYRDDAVARDYDQRWSGVRGRRRDVLKARALERALHVLAVQAAAPARSVLDVPCGTGRFTALLTERCERYVGADLAVPMLRQARRKVPGTRLAVMDLERLPLADRSVDVSVCIRFLHLVRDRGLRLAFLRELARVARHGVVVDYRHDRTLRVRGRRLRHRLGLRERAPSNPSPPAIRGELDDAGLDLLAWLPVRKAPWLSDKVLVVARTADPDGAPAAHS